MACPPVWLKKFPWKLFCADLGFVSTVYFMTFLFVAYFSWTLASVRDCCGFRPVAGLPSPSLAALARRACNPQPHHRQESSNNFPCQRGEREEEGPSSKPLVDVPGLSNSWDTAQIATLQDPRSEIDWHPSASRKAPHIISCWAAPPSH